MSLLSYNAGIRLNAALTFLLLFVSKTKSKEII
jgi:hypothetical protein